MRIKIDMHIHSEYSFDGKTTLKEIAQIARKKGLSAVAVADHNVLPENEIIQNPYIDGILFIPSVEYITEKGHLLGYFLNSRPYDLVPDKMMRVEFDKALEAIKSFGGIAILAHPYERKKHSIESVNAKIKALYDSLDGFEVFNSRAAEQRREANTLAQNILEDKSCHKTAGSDAHLKSEIGNAYIELDVKNIDLESIRKAFESKNYTFSGKTDFRYKIAISQYRKMIKMKYPLKRKIKWLGYLSKCLAKDTADVITFRKRV